MAREQDPLNYSTTPSSTSTTGSGAANYPSGTSSEQIRQDIARTRAEMDETVDALGNRLKPRHVLDEVLEYFNSRTASSGGSGTQSLRDGATGVLERVKDHPMPALLIGAGVAWLLFEGDKQSRTRASRWDRGGRRGDIGEWRNLSEHSGSVVDARTGQPYDESTYGAGYRDEGRSGPAVSSGPGMIGAAQEKLGSAGGALGGAASSAKEALTGAAQSVRSALGGVASSTGSAASGVAGTAGEYASSAREMASEYGSRAYDYAGRGYDTARTGITTAMDEYPLISGVAALALGAVAGLLLPATRRENELMGDYARQAKDQVRHAGEELYDRGKAVAGAAASAAQGAAGDHNVEPGSLTDKVRTIARDVGNAAAQSAGTLIEDVKQVAEAAKNAAVDSSRREGLHPGQLKEAARDVVDRTKEAAKDETKRQKDEMTGR